MTDKPNKFPDDLHLPRLGQQKTFRDVSEAENRGDFEAAYHIANEIGEKWKADQIAAKHDIPGHEFTDLVGRPNEDVHASYRRCVGSRFQKGATAEKLGFKGFEGQVVADIGCNAGHYIEMFRILGAKEVYGIEPWEEALRKAVDSGKLDEEHALLGTLQDNLGRLKSKIDRAAIFNPEVGEGLEDFCRAIYESLNEGGQAAFTFAESERLERYTPILEKYFVLSPPVRLLGKRDHSPHAFLVIADKRPRLLIEE